MSHLFNVALAELPLHRNSSKYLGNKNLSGVAPEALLVAHKDAPIKGIILSDTPFLIDKTCLFGHPSGLPISPAKTKQSGYQWVNQSVFREMVPPVGIEPTLPCGNGILNPARLPVPPEGQHSFYYNEN